MKKIVVVGAGPAGMMAAIRASQLGSSVTLIEKNPILGKKLLLSGKGRCNLTNACELGEFLKRFSGGGEFLRDAFKKFFNRELMDFFEKRGLRMKIERQERVFPASDSSSSITAILKEELHKNKVTLICGVPALNVAVKDKQARGIVLAGGKLMEADCVILACGGASYAFTGSDAEGIALAHKLGHRVVPLRAGLVPLEIKHSYTQSLEGLVLKNIRLTFRIDRRKIVTPIGELLFTRTGISGPLVLSFSGRLVDWLRAEKDVVAELDFKPALSTQQLDSRLLREFKGSPRKDIKNTLTALLPKRLIGVFLLIAGIPANKKVSQLTHPERAKIVSLLKSWEIKIVGALPLEEAMVTRGGVSLDDIDPRTMQSRVIKGLYFAGEMIDVDADTGGFNLQAAFSTGYLAGESAAA